MDWHVLLLTQLARMLLGGGLLLYLAFKLAAPWLPPDPIDRSMAGVLWFWLVLTMVPLVLVQLRLYESVGIWMAFVLIAGAILFVRNRNLNVTLALVGLADSCLRFIDQVSAGPLPGRTWEGIAMPAAPRETKKQEPRPEQPSRRRWTLAGAVLVAAAVLVIILAGAERFADAWLHPGLPYADSGPHLKWLTEMLLNLTYIDGAYSLGMHSMISIFRPLVGMDLATSYRIWGPLASLCWVGTTMWVGARLSGSKWGGILAGTLAGWVGDGNWWSLYRHEGTLPQEFGWVWLLPALWWSYSYLRAGKRQDLALGLAATTVVAASHFGNHAFLLLGLAGTGLATLGSVPFRRTLTLAGGALAASVIAEWHVIWGLLKGHPVAGNNAAYLATALYAPSVKPILWMVLGTGVGLWLISGAMSLVTGRTREKAALPERSVWPEWQLRTRWVLVVFLVWGSVWQIARTGLGRTRLGIIVGAFSNRGMDYVVIIGIIVCAMAFGFVEQALSSRRWGQPAVWVLAFGLLAGSLVILPAPAALSVSRPLSDELVTAARVLGETRDQGQWVAVANRNLYPIALSQSLEVDNFRFWAVWQTVAPDTRGLESAVKTLVGYSGIEVLAFVENDASYPAWEVPPGDPGYARLWEDEYGSWGLSQMILELKAAGLPLPVVWQGPELTVYRIWSPDQATDLSRTGGQ